MIINLENDLERETKNGIVIVDFFATWCGPCKMLHPVLENVSNNYKVVKIDIDKNSDIAKEYNIMSVPTLHIYKDGNLKEKIIGFTTYDNIIDIINNIK